MRTENLTIGENIYIIKYLDDNVISVTRLTDNVQGEVKYIGHTEHTDDEQVYNVYFPDTKFALLCLESGNGNIESGSFWSEVLVDMCEDWEELDELFN